MKPWSIVQCIQWCHCNQLLLPCLLLSHQLLSQCILKCAATYAFSLDCGDLCPLPINSFLPHCYIVAGIWDCKYIPCQRPAHLPHWCLEVMQCQSLPLITFFTVHTVDKHPHYDKVMVSSSSRLLVKSNTHWSWENIGHGVFFLETAVWGTELKACEET